MDFGAFWRAGFDAVRDLGERNFGTNYVRGVFTNNAKHLSVSNI